MGGDVQAAEAAYLEAIHIGQTAGNVYMTLVANANLADVVLAQGRLHQAARVYEETLRLATRPDGQKLPAADRLFAGLARVAYEWNELDAAAQYVAQSLALCQQWGNANLLAAVYVVAAWLERARCNVESAAEAIQAAEQMILARRLSPGQSARVSSESARWWLAQGDPGRARNLLEVSGAALKCLTPQDEISSQQEDEYLLLSRLFLAERDYDRVLSLSQRLRSLAERTKRTGRLIELLALQALAWQGLGDTANALAILEEALALARPEAYVRTFLEEGEPMFRLLFLARSHQPGGSYVSQLLSASGALAPAGPSRPQLLIEPLTPRELEVLSLIHNGHSNLDIAASLVISLPTVKRHISNIYAKLGVKSRTQAVAAASELGLFD